MQTVCTQLPKVRGDVPEAVEFRIGNCIPSRIGDWWHKKKKKVKKENAKKWRRHFESRIRDSKLPLLGSVPFEEVECRIEDCSPSELGGTGRIT